MRDYFIQPAGNPAHAPDSQATQVSCSRIEKNLPGGHPQTRGRDWALGQTKLVSPVTVCPAEEIFQKTCAVAAPRGFLHLICQCSQVARPHHPSCTESPFALLSSVHVVRPPIRRIHIATASPSTLKSAGCTCQVFLGGTYLENPPCRYKRFFKNESGWPLVEVDPSFGPPSPPLESKHMENLEHRALPCKMAACKMSILSRIGIPWPPLLYIILYV